MTAFASDIMSLENINPGMKGIGYTVVENSTIEAFYVDIIKVIKGENGIENMILGKFYGNPIKKSGGISEGMSGSPIYIDGKIIGALSFVVDSDNKNIGAITPILEMIKVDKKNVLELSRIPSNIRVGSAISITPVRGDITLENIGTMTYIKGNKFYALGHQLDGKGSMKYFLNEAKIEYSVPAKGIPYKMGYSLRTIGVVNEDRRAGISGVLTQDIKTYEFITEIKDKNGAKKYFFEMPRDNTTLQMYLSKSYDALLKKKYDADEYKSMEYSYKIYDEKNNLIYENGNFIFFEYSLFENFSALISDEILNVIDNPFKYLNFRKIDMKITLSKEKRIAYIKKIMPSKEYVRIGDKLRININYLIHQKGLINKSIDIKIPKDFEIGNAKIFIFAGDSDKAQEEEAPLNYNYKNLAEFLKYYKSRYKNNELVVKIESSSKNKNIKLRVPFSYSIVFNEEFEEEIIIDTLPANQDGRDENVE
jgi:hypothetical protein